MSDKKDPPESVLLKRDLYTFILVGLLIVCATGLMATLMICAPVR